MNLDKGNDVSEDPLFRQRVFEQSRRVARERGLPLAVAEDISQSVLARLSIMPKDRIDEITNLLAYVSKMIVHEASNYTNKRRREFPITVDADVYSDNLVGAKAVENKVLLSEIWTHLRADDQEILQLLIFGYQPKEIARRLKVNSDAARQRISRLRKSLRKLVFTQR